MSRSFRLAACAASLVACAAGAFAAEPRAFVAPDVSAALASGERVPVIVAFRPDAQRPRGARREALAGTLENVRTFASADVAAGVVDARGAAALLRRPDVLAVTRDGVVHPAGQVGPAQIGADRLLRSGLDGRGRAIAIVDSGIDVLHPDLGGAPAPNGKVWGGWNPVAENDDVADCSGHGTAVAGVAAGADGVAPGAGLVALKVFGGTGGCESARFSDVLAAVDWAVTNAARLEIDVINLSLADESSHTRFCDVEEPGAAAVFAAARAANVAVVAASGNSGRSDGVAWPACFSDVTAVGMVYSQSVGSSTWGGAAGCTDARSGADVVPCASNSGAALALLAPGVRWQTDAPGGGRNAAFSGTSAAAPAAAAALLLARQTRPLSAFAAVDLLRATGAAVVDRKNGLVAPRVDLAAALDAADPVTGPCVSAGRATACEGRAPFLAGRVSSLAVSVTLQRPDADEVTLELVAPDGTTVRLDRSAGAASGIVRAVFGRTVESDEPLSLLSGREASGTWRLVATGATTAPRVVSWSAQVETEAPGSGTGTLPSLFLPAATRGAGRFGAFFATDLRLFNADDQARDATVRFRARAGGPELAVTLTLPPWGTRALDDVLGNAFRAGGAGSLLVDAPPRVVASGRVRSTAARAGSVAMSEPALAAAQALGREDGPAMLLPLFVGEGTRLNVGIVEIAGAPVELVVRVRAGAGGTIGQIPVTLAGGASTQIDDVFERIGQAPDRAGRVDVEVVHGAGRIVAFATSLDNTTNDGALVTSPAPGRFFTVPVPPAPHEATVELKLTSSLGSPVRVKITYVPATGPRPAPLVVPIGRGETRFLENALALFGHDAADGGTLSVSALDGATVLVAARLLDPWRGGVPLGSGRGLAPGRSLAIPFVGPRTSLTVSESAGVDTKARLTLLLEDGTALAAVPFTVVGSQVVSWRDLLAEHGLDVSEDVTALVENLSGGYLSVESLRDDPVTADALAIAAAPIP